MNNQQQPETNNYKEHEAHGTINSRTTKQQLAKYHHALVQQFQHGPKLSKNDTLRHGQC